MLLPLSALCDPCAHGGNLGRRKFLAALSRWHAFPGVRVGDSRDHFLEHRSRFGLEIQPQFTLARCLVGSVALIAIRRENRPHLTVKRDRRGLDIRRQHKEAAANGCFGETHVEIVRGRMWGVTGGYDTARDFLGKNPLRLARNGPLCHQPEGDKF